MCGKIRLLEKVTCPTVLDFRGQGLLDVLDLEPTVVKPNREELAQTLGQPLDSDDALLEAMRSLNQRGAEWVLVTDGPDAVWLTGHGKTYRLQPPTVPAEQAVNPIGCGDAMAGAVAWSIRAGATMPDAVQFGIAASVDNLRQLLPCRLCPDRVQRIAEEVRVDAR